VHVKLLCTTLHSKLLAPVKDIFGLASTVFGLIALLDHQQQGRRGRVTVVHEVYHLAQDYLYEHGEHIIIIIKNKSKMATRSPSPFLPESCN
jgi:hypothetical protein